VYLNNEKLGVIKNGEIQEFEVTPGEHQLKTKIDWCGSESITLVLKEGESVGLELSGYKFGKWIVPIGVGTSIIYFAFGEQIGIHPGYYLAAMVPPLFFMIYLLTLGRDKYLILKKVTHGKKADQ